METYLRLLHYLWRYKFTFALSIVGFLIFAASAPMQAHLMGLVISAIESKDSSKALILPAVAIGIYVIRGIGWFLGSYYNAFVGGMVVNDIKAEVFSHMVELPASFYNERTQGELLHNLNNGVERVREAVTSALKTLIREGFTAIVLLVYAFYLDWKLSLTFLVIAPLLYLTLRYSSKRFRNISRKNEGALGEATQVSKELIANYSVVRGFGAEEYEKSRYDRALARIFRTAMKIRKVESIVDPFTQLQTALVLAVIVYLILQPEYLAVNNTADLVEYLTTIALLPKALKQLSGINVRIQRGIVGAELVFEVMDTEAEEDKGEHTTARAQGKLTFEQVHFSYPDSERLAIENFSTTIAPGEKLAVVGRSGSGKSTLVSLIYRAYQPQQGKILLDDVDIDSYALKNLRQQMSIVDQNIALFDDTIRNNIAYGSSDYTDDQIWEAIRNAYAADFIEALPDGLDTEISENGLKLSGGQRQRISIARAFLKDSPILILDEATSALDNESEAMVKRALEHIMDRRTTIIIAHRLSTIQNADRVLVLDNGKIIEEGAHDALVNKDSYYKALHDAQLA